MSVKSLQKKLKIALLCGGPSLERGISLNSARSVLDHLEDETIEIVPVYFDVKKRAYKISKAQLYSNTPSDFDFKLQQTAKPLDYNSLVKLLKSTDITFIAMHGPFGEDGEIQQFLEKNDIPFVGTGSKSCKQIFDKFKANNYVRELGFYTLPSQVLKIYHKDHKVIIEDFFNKYLIDRAIVKPASGGSSIGVFSVSTPTEALKSSELIFSKRMDTRVVIEPFAKGIEFTVIILENRFGLPVAILPTEIETDYTEHQFFDFRKKYLPTRKVTYHCPPRFSNEDIERIQVQAEQLFAALGMHDFARFDGFLMPDGKIWFSDFNPISGMEQNSFLFQQAARVGLTHRELLRYILRRSCQRYEIKFPEDHEEELINRKPVNVLFGGKTSERQVSLMSGTNVWLKLRKSKKYEPRPYLLDLDNNVWKLPYALTMNHTVEEIAESCKKYKTSEERLGFLENKVSLRLDTKSSSRIEKMVDPPKMSLKEFINRSKYVFIGLHGGEGENGTLQKLLKDANVSFNGPGQLASRLCADKYATSEIIRKLAIPGAGAIEELVVKRDELLCLKNPKVFWKKVCRKLAAHTIVAKPRADGCSSGVVHLYTSLEMDKYIDLIKENVSVIKKGTFKNQLEDIEMPLEPIQEVLFEKFIETDVVRVRDDKLKYRKVSGWIEVTVGILEVEGKIHVLDPSLTVAEGEVLSVEEKFQGGTGVNITPPPSELVSKSALQRSKELIRQVAEGLGINGYSRIDTFMNTKTGDLIIIEVNTLPGLTPSTVLYHQGLAEKPPMFPRELLEKIIEASDY